MVELVLFFSLGFLCAGFIALLLAPVIQRRAERLTRRRIEATVPLTLNEIQADKDRMRAEFAMTIRRLEMSADSYREKATAQLIEINRKREELRALAVERAKQERTSSEVEAQVAELRGELQRREEELQGLSGKLAEAEGRLAEHEQELERLRHMHDETSLESSSRQIELVAREGEIEKLSGTIVELEARLAEAEQRIERAVAETQAAQEELTAEKQRSSALEEEIERLNAVVADQETKIERRAKRMARQRDKIAGADQTPDELKAQLADALAEKQRLEAELAQMSTAQSGEAAAGEGEAAPEDASEERRQNALLRERMLDLAAQVVSMTARLDGPDSPIDRILERTGESTAPENESGEKITSLADRVRALQGAEAGR